MNSTVAARRNRRAPLASITIAAALFAGSSATAFAAPSPLVQSSTTTNLSTNGPLAEFDAKAAMVEKYMRSDANGEPYFDTKVATDSKANAETLEAGEIINEMAEFKRASGAGWNGRVSTPPRGQTTNNGVHIWGNWCGPGHGGGAALGRLDALCRTHDRCYGSRGYFACSCDRELRDGIRRNAGRWSSGGEATAAVAVYTYFNSSLCNPFK